MAQGAFPRMTVGEVAERLGVSDRRVRQIADERGWQRFGNQKATMYLTSDVEAEEGRRRAPRRRHRPQQAIRAAISEIEERTLLRSRRQWSETHNDFMTIEADNVKALTASAQADAGFAMNDYYTRLTLLSMLNAEEGVSSLERAFSDGAHWLKALAVDGPDLTATAHIKAAEEGAELAEDPCLEEWADVALCLLGTALAQGWDLDELGAAVQKKVEINKQRTWHQEPNGSWRRAEGER